MLKNKKTIKILFIIFLVIFPWIVNKTSLDEEITSLNRETISYYQKNSCEISLFDFISNNELRESFQFRFDSYSDISCFGKIQYIEPTANNYVIFIGNHFLINLLIQSLIWLILISFLRTDRLNLKHNYIINAIVVTALLYFHFTSENIFYLSKNINYSPDFYFQNYLLLSFILSIFLICYFIGEVCGKRLEKLIFYFPFLFLINGVFSNSNINFFVIILIFFGIENLKSKNQILKFNILYSLFLIFWNLRNDIKFDFYDIDKLIGFSSTNNSASSLNYWFIVVLLIINGIFFLINESKKFNFELLLVNFLRTGFFIVFLGLLGSINQITNLLVFFGFGQNKFSSLGIESNAGNAWRGFAPSAEMIGEIYALTLLFLLLMIIHNNFKLKQSHIIYLLFITYGIYRANNAAALISLVAIVIYVLLSKYGNKYKNFIYLFLIIIATIGFYFSLRQNTYANMSQSIVYEGLYITSSNIEDESTKIKLLNLIDENNYVEATNILEPIQITSSSLNFLTRNLTSSKNIKFMPNPVAVFGTIALLTNRAEKWGIFFAKYDPSAMDFLLGSGPLNLINYNLNNNIISDGLVLPHSSFLSLLVFVGIIGIALIVFFLFIIWKISIKKQLLIRYLIIYMLINYLKSDAILYFPSFVTITTFILFTFKVGYEERS